MLRCTKVQFHLPVLIGLLFAILFQCFLDPLFNSQGATGGMGRAIAKKAFGKFVIRITFAAFFKLCNASQMPGCVMKFTKLGALVLIFIVLLVIFLLFEIKIVSVITWI